MDYIVIPVKEIEDLMKEYKKNIEEVFGKYKLEKDTDLKSLTTAFYCGRFNELVFAYNKLQQLMINKGVLTLPEKTNKFGT